jgi:hypothetical protein
LSQGAFVNNLARERSLGGFIGFASIVNGASAGLLA